MSDTLALLPIGFQVPVVGGMTAFGGCSFQNRQRQLNLGRCAGGMSKFLDSPFIEITPEMIEAGVDRYQELAEGFSEDYIVREILEAGLKVLEKRQADSPTIRAMAHV